MLKDYGLMDRLGRGLPKVIKHYATKGLLPPIFENGDAFFKVAVWKNEWLS
jgi:ATP-dependent DNA helicase RecG